MTRVYLEHSIQDASHHPAIHEARQNRVNKKVGGSSGKTACHQLLSKAKFSSSIPVPGGLSTPVHSCRRKPDRCRPAARCHQCCVRPREVHPPRPLLHAAFMVGAPASSGSPGRSVASSRLAVIIILIANHLIKIAVAKMSCFPWLIAILPVPQC